jgi:hypothetical protein
MLRIFTFLFFSFSCFALDLSVYEKSLYSPHGEDGVLAKIFQMVQPDHKYVVEFNAGSGHSGTVSYVLRLQNWKGLLMDRAYEAPQYNLCKEFVTAENVNDLFIKYEVPTNLDLLIMNHHNEFYIWQGLDGKYRPKVVVIRYNGQHGASEDKIAKYRPYSGGDGTEYFGASILSMTRLAKTKGYSLIYAESTGTNLFFVRDVYAPFFDSVDDVEGLYKPSLCSYKEDKKHRPYFTFEEL